MDIEPLWTLYRDLTRQAFETEKKYKAEKAAEKPYSTLTYIELNDIRARAGGVMRSIEALSEDKHTAWKRGFEIWQEENGLAPEGEFGCWMPVKKKPYPDALGMPCYVTAVKRRRWRAVFEAYTDIDVGYQKIVWCTHADRFRDSRGGVKRGWTVTAWMPLPDPYTEDSAESDTHEEE